MRRLALIAAAGVFLAGCGWGGALGPRPRPHDPSVRAPLVLPAPRQLQLDGFVRLVSPTRLAIATWGSSSCPSVPDELVVEDPNTIRIHLVTGSWEDGRPVAHPPASGICTADLGTTRMLVAIDPQLIDVHHPLTVRVFYRDSKKPRVYVAPPLQRYPVVIHSPAVLPVPRALQGRFGISGMKFVSPTRLGIVTVGSGSCPWIPDELTVLGPSRISIRLAMGGFRNGRGVIYHGRFGCTLDLGPTRMLLAIDPKLIDVHRPLTVMELHVPGGKTPGVVTVAPLKPRVFAR